MHFTWFDCKWKTKLARVKQNTWLCNKRNSQENCNRQNQLVVHDLPREELQILNVEVFVNNDRMEWKKNFVNSKNEIIPY